MYVQNIGVSSRAKRLCYCGVGLMSVWVNVRATILSHVCLVGLMSTRLLCVSCYPVRLLSGRATNRVGHCLVGLLSVG